MTPTDSENHSAATTTAHVKQACQELLKNGLVEQQSKPNIYKAIVASQAAIVAVLEPLDLSVTIDEVRGLAFLVLAATVHTTKDEPTEALEVDANDDSWSHPLVRKQRLKLEHSLLIAILRQLYMAHESEAGIGVAQAMVDLDDLQSRLGLYLGESGSASGDRKRLVSLLENLKAHGFVSDISAQEEVQIRPIITHVASPSTLTALLEHFRSIAGTDKASEAHTKGSTA